MASPFNNEQFLMVPTRLDTLLVNEGGQNILEPFARFGHLPYSRTEHDGKEKRLVSVNYDQPYISETVFSKPFYNNDNQLEPGVHLHWSLPDALTIARKWTPSDKTSFPAVPDRWLVMRYRAGSNTPDKKWMVLSNYLWPEGTEPEFIDQIDQALAQIGEDAKNKLLAPLRQKGSVADLSPQHKKALNRALAMGETFLNLPEHIQHEILDLALLYDVQAPRITYHHQPPKALGDYPFRYMGWVESFTENWTPPPIDANNSISGLTTLGYGEQTFAAFYPNCRNVFGMCDPDIDKKSGLNGVSYEVYGWYSQPEAEFLTPLVTSFETGGVRHGKDWLKVIQNTIGWTLPDDQNSSLPTKLMCYSKIRFNTNAKGSAILNIPKDHLSPSSGTIIPTKAPALKNIAQIAIGNTSTEALSAYLSGVITAQKVAQNKIKGAQQIEAARKRIENQLESLNLRNHLPDQSPDFAALFDEARHNSTFKAVSGGRLWTLRPETAKNAGQQQLRDMNQEVSSGRYFLPAGLSEQLHRINHLQKLYNHSNEVIRFLRHQIFADWQHYMRASYHDPDENFLPSSALKKFPDIDAAKDHVNQLIKVLDLYLAYTGKIQYDKTKLQTDDDPWSAVSLLAGAPPSTAIEIDQLIPEGQVAFREWLMAIEDSPATINESLAKQIAEQLNDVHQRLREYDAVIEIVRDHFNQLQAATNWSYDDYERLAGKLSNWFGRYIPGMVLPQFNALALVREVRGPNRSRLAHNILLGLLKSLASLPKLYLEPTVAPRYYLPKDPVLLLAGPVLESTNRHGMDNIDGLLLCHPLGNAITSKDVLSDSFINAVHQYTNIMGHVSGHGLNKTDGNPWHTLFFEWEVAINPVEEKTNVSTFSARYDADFISTHYKLEKLSSEYIPDINTPTTSSNSYFSGRSVLTPFAETKLMNEIEYYISELAKDYWMLSASDAEKEKAPDGQDHWLNYFNTNETAIIQHYDQQYAGAIAILRKIEGLDEDAIHNHSELHTIIDAWSQIKTWRKYSNDPEKRHFIQTQALSGFNEALLMLHKSIQIEIAEPNGFEEYTAFSKKVREAVRTQNQLAIMPDVDFHPIRNGQLQLYRLRLVDTFGRVLLLIDRTQDELSLPQIYAPQQMQVNIPGTVLLPPRISQPTQLSFRWLAADNDTLETNTHPDTSPICGWVVANNLDNSLMIYAAQGGALGYIDLTGTWRAAPGKNTVAQVSDIENQALQQMVNWFISQVKPSNKDTYIPTLIDAMETIMENIDPANYAQHQARSLLMGRPLALVQASMDLKLKSWPAVHQDTQRNKQVVNGMPYQHDGFTSVDIPVRIGEYDRLNDGVVLYWKSNDTGYEGDQYYSPLDALEISQTLADPPQKFTILMDPRGLLHCTTGILPTKALSIPPGHYVTALQKLQVTFLSTPILSEQGHIHLNLPDEPGFSWSWIERQGNSWNTLTQRLVLLQSKVLTAFDDGEDIWNLLLEKGWMDLVENEMGKAYLRAAGDRSDSTLFDDENKQAETEQILGKLVVGIIPASTDARFGPQAAIREGWLSLFPEQDAWD